MGQLEFNSGLDIPLGLLIGAKFTGYDELGNPVYRGSDGRSYAVPGGTPTNPTAGMGGAKDTGKKRGSVVKGLARDPIEGMKSIAKAIYGGTVDAVAMPGRAAAGEIVTMGDILNTAGMVQLGGAAMPAPKGALRSGAVREAATAAQSKADEVLQLLKSGRGAEVTDDMLAAADPQALWSGYDLPMDASSRMDRATGMGFDTDTPLYHGTDASFHSFKPSKNGNWGDGVYLAHDPSIASDFALEKSASINYGGDPSIFTVVSKGKYPSVNSETFTGNERGFDANLLGGVKYRVVPDPINIRSQFARFDPRLAHLSNLNASNASPSVGAMTMAQILSEEEATRRPLASFFPR